MARYIVSVRSPRAPGDAFAYMADLNNFAEWDPGVTAVEQVEGDDPALDAAYDVTVQAVPRPLVLRYHLVTYEPDTSFVARAQSRTLTSNDIITVEPDGDGSIVTYDAELTFNGLLGVANPFLARVFDRIGDKAARGLIRVLEGERVSSAGAAT